jgi:hypothetical protein
MKSSSVLVKNKFTAWQVIQFNTKNVWISKLTNAWTSILTMYVSNKKKKKFMISECFEKHIWSKLVSALNLNLDLKK